MTWKLNLLYYPAYEVQWNQDTSTNTNNMLNKSDLKKKKNKPNSSRYFCQIHWKMLITKHSEHSLALLVVYVRKVDPL